MPLDYDPETSDPRKKKPKNTPAPQQGPPSYPGQPGFYTPKVQSPYPSYVDRYSPSPSTSWPSSSYTPPTQSSPKPKPKPKDRTQQRRKRTKKSLDALNAIFDGSDFTGLMTSQDRLGALNLPVGRTEDPELESGSTLRRDQKRLDNLTEFLQGINVDPKAPGPKPGDTLDDYFNYLPDVPNRFKTRRNGDLKRHWDEDYIRTNLTDFNGEGWRISKFINDMMEQQYQDREQFLLGRNKRTVNTVRDVLGDAADAARDGDYTYLERYMQEHPNFSLEIPEYSTQVGVNSDQVWQQWLKERENLSPEERAGERYRIDPLMQHLDNMRFGNKYSPYSFGRSRKKIQESIDWYEERFNDSVEFGLDSDDDEIREAAEDAQGNPIIPEVGISDEEQDLFDTVGDARDPNNNSWVAQGISAVSNKGRKLVEKQDRKETRAARRDAKATLGVDELPSVKDMLTVQVQNGILDPDDKEAVAEWIQRFRNPNHPDTRAMYAGFAMQQNKDLASDEEGLVGYINAPLMEYAENAQERMKAKEKEASEEQNHDLWRGAQSLIPVLGTYLNAADGDSERPALEQAFDLHITPEGLVNQEGSGSSAVGWTFDKLSRLSYGIAGAFNAWYQLDQEPTKAWHGQDGFIGTSLNFVTDPVSGLTGQSWIESLDDVAEDPGSLAEPFKEGYQQVFRGSDLPGIKDNVVPITFSQVIANNAARDGENNIYDKSWYQHVAGFGLDVALDPLNLIGVGVVDDTLKIPVRITKGLAQDAVQGVSTTSSNFLRAIQNSQMGPVAEKAFRGQQALKRLGDDITGSELITDTELYPVTYGIQERMFPDNDGLRSVPDYGFEFGAENSISSELNKLNIQTKKLLNDVAVESLTESMAQIQDDLGVLTFNSGTDFRMGPLKAMNSTPIAGAKELGLNLHNPGGRFWQYLNSADENARLQGFSTTEFARDPSTGALTTLAAKGQRALDEQAKLEELGLAAPETKARIERDLDEASSIDEATGKPSMYQKGDLKAYYEAGMPGMPKTGWSPYKAFADAYKMTPEELRAVGVSERDVHDALTLGPAMYIRDDPAAAAQLKDAKNRVETKQHELRVLGKMQSAKAVAKRKAAYKALQIGYEQMSEITLGGALRYIDTLMDMRRSAVGDPALTENLQGLLGNIDEVLEGEISTKDLLGDYLGGFEGTEGALPIRNGDFSDFDFTKDTTLAEIEAHLPEEFTGRASQLEAAREAITEKLKALKLDETVEVTGLPPAQAYQANQLLPVGSSFRKADGTIDSEKIANALTYDFNRKTEAFNISYKVPKPSADADEAAQVAYKREVAFFDILKGALTFETRGAYRGEKTRMLNSKRTTAATDEAPAVGSRVQKLGPRPTFESLRKAKPGIYDSHVSRGSKARTKYEDAQRELDLETERIQTKYDDAHSRGEMDSRNYQLANDSLSMKYATQSKALRKKYSQPDPEIKSEEVLTFQGGVKGVPGEYVRTFEVKEGAPSKKTRRQSTWEQYVKREQAKWDKAHARAKELDAADLRSNQREVSLGFKLNKEEFQTASQAAYKKALDGTLKSLRETGEIKQVPTNVRVTVNEQAANIKRKIKLETQYKLAELKVAELEAKNAEELKILRKQADELRAREKAMYAEVEVARKEAILTRKVAATNIKVEHVLQALNMPTRMTGKMMQLRILGMRKNLQFSNSMFRGMEQTVQLLPAKFRENFANYMVRPSKQLSQPESIRFRAMWESHTPVIIHAHLTDLSHAMRELNESERRAMFNAYRDGRSYDGPKNEHYEAFSEQIKEVEDIFNGAHDFYFFKRADEFKGEALKPYEIQRFIPAEYNFKLSALYAARNERVRKEGGKPVERTVTDPFSQKPEPANDFTIEDIIQAVKMNDLPNPKDLTDPFRVAWVYRMAADQAHQLKALKHSVEETFGVRIPRDKEKILIANQLKMKYGWKTVPGLDEAVLFPPESHKDIAQLIKITQPGPESAKLFKLFDDAIGYWKQGMTIYNPGYYTRNGIGEIMSSWLDGVNHPKWYRMAYRVHKFTKSDDVNLAELVKKWNVLEGTLPVDVAKGNEILFKLKGGQVVRIEDALREYIRTGMKSTFANTDIDRGLRGLAGSTLTDSKARKLGRWQNEKIHAVGEGFEDWLRMSHFLHAMQHSGRGSLKAAADYAATRVTKYHFDYSDFSKFEQSVMLRAFPFYKWTRRGAPLMLAHLAMTPGKMTALPKAMDAISGLGFDPLNALPGGDPLFSTQDVHQDNNGYLPDYQGIAPQWVTDLFAYQMQPAEDDEYANYFRIQTPQVDGLNAALSMAQHNPLTDPVGFLGDSPGYPLLNPAIKMPLELGRNQGTDPDFPYEIYGGEYNEERGINPVEAIVAYAGRQLNPWTGFLAKLSKNGDLGPLSIRDGNAQREVRRDVASQLTGLGFYQGFPDPTTTGNDPEDTTSSPAVGGYRFSEIPMFSGRKAASRSSDPNNDRDSKLSFIRQLLDEAEGNGYTSNGWQNFGSNGWVDFGNFWRNYGRGGGFSSNYYGGGYSSSSSDSSSWTSFLDFIEQLKAMIDQGKVIDD